MKKVINEKTYDTETAKAIAIYSSCQNPEHPVFWSECLYMMDNGEFFLHGKGGTATHYAIVYKNGHRKNSERIIPMTKEKLVKWLRCYYNNGLMMQTEYTDIIENLYKDPNFEGKELSLWKLCYTK